jgi:hypothetical protein
MTDITHWTIPNLEFKQELESTHVPSLTRF